MKKLSILILLSLLLTFNTVYAEIYFAELDQNNKVIRVIVVSEENALNEAAGIIFCNKLLGGTWKQTYNTGKRKNYAGIGYVFDEAKDAFIPPQPYSSWSLDEDCNWQAPVPMPDDGKIYSWNEKLLIWELL